MNAAKCILVTFLGVGSLYGSSPCPAPALTFCNVNADCVSTTTLTVTDTSVFEGPVIISNTGTTDECFGGALSVAGDVGVLEKVNVCGFVTVGGARNSALLAQEGLRSVPGCTGAPRRSACRRCG